MRVDGWMDGFVISQSRRKILLLAGRQKPVQHGRFDTHTQTALEAGRILVSAMRLPSVPVDVLAGFGERNETKVERMPASIDRKHTDNRNLEDALTQAATMTSCFL